MPASELQLDSRVQELIFLGYLFSHPTELPNYAPLLEQVKIFQSREGQHIWNIAYKYYEKYGALPTREVWHNTGLTTEEVEDLNIATDELTFASPDYKFMLDSFTDTLQLAIYRNATEAFETTIKNGGGQVLSKLKEIEDRLLSQLLICRNAEKTTMQGTLRGTLSGWFDGGLMFQQPKVAIPIKGMENVSGSPKGSVNLLVGAYGAGKAQPVSLVIPTPVGNRKWGDLKPGDYVFGANGQPTKILQVFPQGAQDIYRVTFDDGSSTLCSKDHLWTVYGARSRTYDYEHRLGKKVSWRVLTTQEIMDAGVTRSRGEQKPVKQWQVPCIQPVEYLGQHEELPIAPYVLGLWLGAGNPKNGTIAVNSTNHAVIDYLKALNSNTTVKTCMGTTMLSVVVPGIIRGLKQLNLFSLHSWERFIPNEYIETSSKDRYELLRGLLDSTGYCGRTGVVLSCHLTNQKLSEQVLFIVRSLGGKGSTEVSPPTAFIFTLKGDVAIAQENRPVYKCNFVLPPELGCPFLVKPKRADRYRVDKHDRYLYRYIAKIEKLDYQEECMCIKVEAEDSLYLANDFIPTHNTTTLASMTAYLLHSYNVLYVTLETSAEAIVFKIISNLTEGRVRAKTVHEMPNSEKLTAQEVATLKAFKVAFDNAKPTTEDESVNIDLTGVGGSISKLHTLFHLTMSPGTATAAQLEVYIREIQRKTGLKIDTVMVDYAALMKTNSGGSKDDIGWSYTGTIMMELAAVAQNLGLIIWTAAQAGGQNAHTTMSTTAQTFKPIRGADVYGSKEILQNSSLVYGLSFVRSSRHPHLAVGVLSTLKNRYGTEFYDYICTMNYGLAKLQVVEIYDAYASGDGGVIEKVYSILRNLELNYDNRQNSRLSELDLANKKQAKKTTTTTKEENTESTTPTNPITEDEKLAEVLKGINVDTIEESKVRVGTVESIDEIEPNDFYLEEHIEHDPSDPDNPITIVVPPMEPGSISFMNGIPIKEPRHKKQGQVPLTDTDPLFTVNIEGGEDTKPEVPVTTIQTESKKAETQVKVIESVVKTATNENKSKMAQRVMNAKLGRSSSTDSPF